VDEPAINTDQTSQPPPAPPETTPRAGWASAISMAEAGLLTDVGIVFDLAWIYVPILGTAFMPLIPAPFAILYLRRGARITLFAACVGGFLMTVLVGPHYGWRLTLEAIIGMTIGWAMRRRWSPTLAITLGLFIDATVAYVAAFGAVYALGLPLHDLYLELRNLLVSVGWLLDTSATLLGLQSAWLGVRPFFAAVARFSLAYWIPMFYLYVTAIAAPLVVLYYSVASTTAFALGHDVRPFPSPWMWRATRVVGVILSPLAWLARLLWRLVTAPLWGPFWLARALGRRRRQRRLRGELATADTRTQQGRLPALPTPSEPRSASGAPCDGPLLEAAGSGREAGE
jgi:hypothetical protein